MKIKILNIGQNFRVTGGSDRYFFDLAAILEKNGNEVIPFAAKHPDNLPNIYDKYFPDSANFEDPKFRDAFKYLFSSSAKKNIIKVIEEFKPDIAHLHIYYGKITSSIIKPLRAAGIPIVQTLHEYKMICPVYTLNRNGHNCEECKVGNYWKVIKNLCNRGSFSRSLLSGVESYVSYVNGAYHGVDKFIAVSDFLRLKMIEKGVDKNKIVTIPNFTRTEIAAQNLAEDAGYDFSFNDEKNESNSKNDKYVIYFGRLEFVKGIHVLLDSARKMPGTRFKIVGSGGYGKNLRDFAEKMSLNNVEFIPFVEKDQLIKLIKNAAVSVVPSLWYETFGLTVIESYALGVPVVVSKIGGVSDLVENGETGYVVIPGDSDALAEKINVIINNSKLQKKMGERAKKVVFEKYNENVHYEKIKQVYCDLLKKK